MDNISHLSLGVRNCLHDPVVALLGLLDRPISSQVKLHENFVANYLQKIKIVSNYFTKYSRIDNQLQLSNNEDEEKLLLTIALLCKSFLDSVHQIGPSFSFSEDHCLKGDPCLI